MDSRHSRNTAVSVLPSSVMQGERIIDGGSSPRVSLDYMHYFQELRKRFTSVKGVVTMLDKFPLEGAVSEQELASYIMQIAREISKSQSKLLAPRCVSDFLCRSLEIYFDIQSSTDNRFANLIFFNSVELMLCGLLAEPHFCETINQLAEICAKDNRHPISLNIIGNCAECDEKSIYNIIYALLRCRFLKYRKIDTETINQIREDINSLFRKFSLYEYLREKKDFSYKIRTTYYDNVSILELASVVMAALMKSFFVTGFATIKPQLWNEQIVLVRKLFSEIVDEKFSGRINTLELIKLMQEYSYDFVSSVVNVRSSSIISGLTFMIDLLQNTRPCDIIESYLKNYLDSLKISLDMIVQSETQFTKKVVEKLSYFAKVLCESGKSEYLNQFFEVFTEFYIYQTKEISGLKQIIQGFIAIAKNRFSSEAYYEFVNYVVRTFMDACLGLKKPTLLFKVPLFIGQNKIKSEGALEIIDLAITDIISSILIESKLTKEQKLEIIKRIATQCDAKSENFAYVLKVGLSTAVSDSELDASEILSLIVQHFNLFDERDVKKLSVMQRTDLVQKIADALRYNCVSFDGVLKVFSYILDDLEFDMNEVINKIVCYFRSTDRFDFNYLSHGLLQYDLSNETVSVHYPSVVRNFIINCPDYISLEKLIDYCCDVARDMDENGSLVSESVKGLYCVVKCRKEQFDACISLFVDKVNKAIGSKKLKEVLLKSIFETSFREYCSETNCVRSVEYFGNLMNNIPDVKSRELSAEVFVEFAIQLEKPNDFLLPICSSPLFSEENKIIINKYIESASRVHPNIRLTPVIIPSGTELVVESPKKKTI